jgi:hypothetical protein
MQKLNFPAYAFRFKNRENKSLIFDPIRKKFVVLTPEEWVRQHLLQFLLSEQNYPAAMMNVEKQISGHHLTKRYDLVVFDPDGSVFMLGECKAPSVPVTQVVFDQAAQYNYALNAPYLLVSNGLQHLVARIDTDNRRYDFLGGLPSYPRK